jgi:hypothetical protein
MSDTITQDRGAGVGSLAFRAAAAVRTATRGYVPGAAQPRCPECNKKGSHEVYRRSFLSLTNIVTKRNSLKIT